MRYTRSTIGLLHAIHLCTDGVTYKGIRHLLDINSDSGVRALVRRAQEEGVIYTVRTGVGRGNVVIIKITQEGYLLLKHFKP